VRPSAMDMAESRWQPGWYDLGHNRITMAEAERLLADGESRQIAQDVVLIHDEPVWVSTVFLVLDHNFGDGPPLLYETMTFSAAEELSDLCNRYCTRAAAEEGHAAVLAELLMRASH
jgi:hypothetical protein